MKFWFLVGHSIGIRRNWIGWWWSHSPWDWREANGNCIIFVQLIFDRKSAKSNLFARRWPTWIVRTKWHPRYMKNTWTIHKELQSKVTNLPPLAPMPHHMHFYFIQNYRIHSVDPCRKVHCGAGRVCEAKGDTAKCICIPSCPQEADPRRRVCTNRNETWNSDCEVHRQRCLCDMKDVEQCNDPELKHIHIDYYGECKELPVSPIWFYIWLFSILYSAHDIICDSSPAPTMRWATSRVACATGCSTWCAIWPNATPCQNTTWTCNTKPKPIWHVAGPMLPYGNGAIWMVIHMIVRCRCTNCSRSVRHSCHWNTAFRHSWNRAIQMVTIAFHWPSGAIAWDSKRYFERNDRLRICWPNIFRFCPMLTGWYARSLRWHHSGQHCWN